MKGVPVSPRRVFGVAFSDAEDAGRHIWICRGHPGDAGVRVESVDRLCDLPGGEVDRRAAFRALVAKILDAPRSAWGLDFAFGLPEAGVDRVLDDGPPIGDGSGDRAPARERWRALLARVAEARDPASLAAGDGRRRAEESVAVAAPDPRDRERDLRGLAGVLSPLAAQPHVAVLPHEPLPVLPEGTPPGMRARAPHIYLLEVWPRALLERLRRQELQSLAGVDTEEGRDEVVRGLVGASLVRPMAQRTRRAFAGDDTGRPLDALLAAVGAWKGCRETDHNALCADPRTGLEGHLYP